MPRLHFRGEYVHTSLRSATFFRRKYRIQFGRWYHGDRQAQYLGRIHQDPKLKGFLGFHVDVGRSRKQLLKTGLHEALHACFWDASEARVRRAEEEIYRFLSRLSRVGMRGMKPRKRRR